MTLLKTIDNVLKCINLNYIKMYDIINLFIFYETLAIYLPLNTFWEDKNMINETKRKTTIQFIRAEHPSLYDELKANVQAIFNDDGIISQEDINLYNSIVKKYCENYGPALQKRLSF